MFAVVRIGLGIWSFFVPAITKAGFHTLAWILTGFVAASALLDCSSRRRTPASRSTRSSASALATPTATATTSRGSPANKPARACRRSPDQRGFVARMVEPIAPNLAALRRVSSNAERA